MRPIPQTALAFIDRVERCVLRVYDDAQPDKVLQPGDKVIGTLTAGRGHTGFICIGDLVTPTRADEWTRQDLREAGEQLEHKIGAAIVLLLTENQYSALLSFVFNCGTGDPNKPEWNIWRVLRAKNFAQVPLELAKFVNGKIDGKTVKISGLVRRRNLEIELWSLGEPGSVQAEAPLRKLITPPTPVDPTPAVKSKPVVAGAIAAASAMPVAFSQVHNAIAPLAHNPHSAAVAAISTIGAVSAGASVLFSYLHNKRQKT